MHGSGIKDSFDSGRWLIISTSFGLNIATAPLNHKSLQNGTRSFGKPLPFKRASQNGNYWLRDATDGWDRAALGNIKAGQRIAQRRDKGCAADWTCRWIHFECLESSRVLWCHCEALKPRQTDCLFLNVVI